MARGFCQKKIDTRAAATLSMIKGGLAGMDMNQTHLAQKTHIKYRTLCDRTKNTESIKNMRLGELWAIIDVLKPDDRQKVDML